MPGVMARAGAWDDEAWNQLRGDLGGPPRQDRAGVLTDVLGKHSSSQLGRAMQTSSGSMCEDLKLKEGGKHRPWALGHRLQGEQDFTQVPSSFTSGQCAWGPRLPEGQL